MVSSITIKKLADVDLVISILDYDDSTAPAISIDKTYFTLMKDQHQTALMEKNVYNNKQLNRENFNKYSSNNKNNRNKIFKYRKVNNNKARSIRRD
eukprot:UN09630